MLERIENEIDRESIAARIHAHLCMLNAVDKEVSQAIGKIKKEARNIKRELKKNLRDLESETIPAAQEDLESLRFALKLPAKRQKKLIGIPKYNTLGFLQQYIKYLQSLRITAG